MVCASRGRIFRAGRPADRRRDGGHARGVAAVAGRAQARPARPVFGLPHVLGLGGAVAVLAARHRQRGAAALRAAVGSGRRRGVAPAPDLPPSRVSVPVTANPRLRDGESHFGHGEPAVWTGRVVRSVGGARPGGRGVRRATRGDAHQRSEGIPRGGVAEAGGPVGSVPERAITGRRVGAGRGGGRDLRRPRPVAPRRGLRLLCRRAGTAVVRRPALGGRRATQPCWSAGVVGVGVAAEATTRRRPVDARARDRRRDLGGAGRHLPRRTRQDPRRARWTSHPGATSRRPARSSRRSADATRSRWTPRGWPGRAPSRWPRTRRTPPSRRSCGAPSRASPGCSATARSTRWTRWSGTARRATCGSAGPRPAPTTW